MARAVWLLLLAGVTLAYANTFTRTWTERWFPAWTGKNLGLYDRLVEGESYYTHGPLVPIVSLAVGILLVRSTRMPVRPRPVIGFLVLGGSLVLHLLACLARVYFASGFSFIGVVAGLILMLWGTTALRRLWFPVAFLAFMVPLPEVSIIQLNFWLRNIAAATGVWLANAVGVAAERMGDKGNQVLLEGDKTLVIANVCNGLRTVISLLAFGAIYAYVCKLRGGWRLLLFSLSIPVAAVSNAVRILGLIVVADVWDVATATGWFHDASGLAIYVVAYLMMFGAERAILRARQLAKRPAVVLPLFHGIRKDPQDREQWPQLVRAAGGAAGVAAALGVLATAGAALALLRTVPPAWNEKMAGQALPAALDMDGRHWQSVSLELPSHAILLLRTSDYLYRRYSTPGLAPVELCVIFSRDDREATHAPEICLEGQGQDLLESRDVVVPGVEGRGQVRCHELVLQSGAERQVFLYVYKCGNEYTASFTAQQFMIFGHGLLGRRPSGALVRVSTSAGDDLEPARRRAMTMLRTAIPYLDRALP